jgi:hypothetical protein
MLPHGNGLTGYSQDIKIHMLHIIEPHCATHAQRAFSYLTDVVAFCKPECKP